MGGILSRALVELDTQLTGVQTRVHRQVELSLQSLEQRDMLLAQRSLKLGSEFASDIDELEQCCLRALTLYQPVATDLRYIIYTLHVGQELHSLRRYSTSLASRSRSLAVAAEIGPSLAAFTARALQLLTQTFETTETYSSELDRTTVVQQYREFRRQIEVELAAGLHTPDGVHTLLEKLAVSRALKRISILLLELQSGAATVALMAYRRRLHG